MQFLNGVEIKNKEIINKIYFFSILQEFPKIIPTIKEIKILIKLQINLDVS